MKKIIALLVLFLSGCAANQAAFISEPPGAQVIVNGEVIGTTPCKLEYRCDSGTDYEVVIQKDGYEPVRHTFKSDEIDRGERAKWVTASILLPLGSPLLIGALFTKKLKDSYEFVLKQETPQVARQDQGKVAF
ncbi:hypothetical protein C2E25_07645 [Geothermobacter hydrogeniphilus]|uniref:PEGA domain-containing protein n=1 Tax=Geothermobacter hydrogeniphilus TaxID=1969733 RepID=A0A2K2HAZ2_9BACT|nr:PEGA domain-containing protein [Geothermobacter hydrogeniphilus]PNU20427.1 hypothetical protein C2E25_07645 [Geothermobacter hydrogeniphilus]